MCMYRYVHAFVHGYMHVCAAGGTAVAVVCAELVAVGVLLTGPLLLCLVLSLS